MRILKIVFFFIILINAVQSTAQYDSIFAVVTGDTVTLWQTGSCRNCGALYRMEMNQVENQLDWYQVDSGLAAFCYCNFDLSVTYGPLESGNYFVNVYYTESISEDTVFDGSTSFTIGSRKPENRSGIISQYQSACSGVGIFDPDDAENDHFRIYPVPVRDGELIHLEIFPTGGNAVIEVFTITGKLVYSKHYNGNQPIKNRWMKNEIFPVSGLYLAKLSTGDVVYIRKIIVL